MANKFDYYSDCKYFRGDVPCKPHKETGVHCNECSKYSKQTGKILIIKLGAIGDVIRTTPLLHKIREVYPDYSIWWLTYTPEILPQDIDRILQFNLESILLLQATQFKKIINLDKDPHACALVNILKTNEKNGFILDAGKPSAVDKMAEHKFITGIFDDANKENNKSYPEEIFEICGWQFNGEEYLINNSYRHEWNFENNGKLIVGLNTGCGGRWTTRLWKEEYWIELINMLQSKGFYPVLLGGEQEHEKNIRIQSATNTLYPGHFSLQKFISLVDKCDIVVTAVTMALHIAVALRKKVVLVNNIFNPKEFELYGRGVIIEPDKPCECFFSPTCKNPDYFCMEHLLPGKVMDGIISL